MLNYYKTQNRGIEYIQKSLFIFVIYYCVVVKIIRRLISVFWCVLGSQLAPYLSRSNTNANRLPRQNRTWRLILCREVSSYSCWDCSWLIAISSAGRPAIVGSRSFRGFSRVGSKQAKQAAASELACLLSSAIVNWFVRLKSPKSMIWRGIGLMA